MSQITTFALELAVCGIGQPAPGSVLKCNTSTYVGDTSLGSNDARQFHDQVPDLSPSMHLWSPKGSVSARAWNAGAPASLFDTRECRATRASEAASRPAAETLPFGAPPGGIEGQVYLVVELPSTLLRGRCPPRTSTCCT